MYERGIECVCVCERERERERKNKREREVERESESVVGGRMVGSCHVKVAQDRSNQSRKSHVRSRNVRRIYCQYKSIKLFSDKGCVSDSNRRLKYNSTTAI